MVVCITYRVVGSRSRSLSTTVQVQNTNHTYANRYGHITLDHRVAHHGLCRLYLSSSRNKSKPDAVCILYSRQGHNVRFRMQTFPPYRGNEHVEQCCHPGQKYNLYSNGPVYGLFEIRCSGGGGKPSESITCTIITPYHTVSIFTPLYYSRSS